MKKNFTLSDLCSIGKSLCDEQRRICASGDPEKYSSELELYQRELRVVDAEGIERFKTKELAILDCLIHDIDSYIEIGKKVKLSAGSVSVYIHLMMDKTDTKTRAGLVSWCYRHEII